MGCDIAGEGGILRWPNGYGIYKYIYIYVLFYAVISCLTLIFVVNYEKNKTAPNRLVKNRNNKPYKK